LINVLNVLGWLVELEPQQADVLERICNGPLITLEDLEAAGALEAPAPRKRTTRSKQGGSLFDL
jgi:hypothetical protein